jgi:hypothetical protein
MAVSLYQYETGVSASDSERAQQLTAALYLLTTSLYTDMANMASDQHVLIMCWYIIVHVCIALL